MTKFALGQRFWVWGSVLLVGCIYYACLIGIRKEEAAAKAKQESEERAKELAEVKRLAREIEWEQSPYRGEHARLLAGLLRRVDPESEAATVGRPVLIAACFAKDPALRSEACRAVGKREINQVSLVVLRGLIAELGQKSYSRDKEQEATRSAIIAFGATAIPALIEALSDNRPLVRCHAAEVLRLIGRSAQTAVPALIKSLSIYDSGAETGFWWPKCSVVALNAIDPEWRDSPAAREAMPALERHLNDENSPQRLGAMQALRILRGN